MIQYTSIKGALKILGILISIMIVTFLFIRSGEKLVKDRISTKTVRHTTDGLARDTGKLLLVAAITEMTTEVPTTTVEPMVEVQTMIPDLPLEVDMDKNEGIVPKNYWKKSFNRQATDRPPSKKLTQDDFSEFKPSSLLSNASLVLNNKFNKKLQSSSDTIKTIRVDEDRNNVNETINISPFQSTW